MRRHDDFGHLEQPAAEIMLVIGRDMTARQTGLLGGPRAPAETDAFFEEALRAAIARHALGFYDARFLRAITIAACSAVAAVLTELRVIVENAGNESADEFVGQKH